jgi:hypothetical protein
VLRRYRQRSSLRTFFIVVAERHVMNIRTAR